MKRLDGKTAIITGSSKGIGRAMAQIFAAEGARVVVVSRHAEAGEQVASDIRKAGGEAFYRQADVSRWEDVEGLVKATVDRYGTVDIFCSNAAIFPSNAIEDMPIEEWQDVLSVNLNGAFYGMKACFPIMKRQQYGRIVLTSSITGPHTGFPGWTHYGASKAGMLGLMRCAALECAKDGVTINAILPGNIQTEGMDEQGEDYIESVKQAIPMGRLGDPADVAYMALFLASPEAKYTTGQTFIIDGGQILPESPLAIL
jgi:3-oxoacyl-[acyl-carrier protein] reductase